MSKTLPLPAPPPAAATSAALRALLRQRNLRATAARLAVLQCLKARPGPVSHAELVASLSDHGVDRATVYRNLIDLTRVGLVHRADLGDHVWRFELAARPGHDADGHPHFVCTSCGDVQCLPDGGIAIRDDIVVPRAVRSSTVQVQLRGVCDSC